MHTPSLTQHTSSVNYKQSSIFHEEVSLAPCFLSDSFMLFVTSFYVWRAARALKELRGAHLICRDKTPEIVLPSPEYPADYNHCTHPFRL